MGRLCHWMITLRERSQTQKEKHYMVSFTGGILKKKKKGREEEEDVDEGSRGVGG